MTQTIFTTEIECSLTMMGADIAQLDVCSDKIKLTKLKTQMDIPSEIIFSAIKTIKFKITKNVDFKIEIGYLAEKEIKYFNFVTCNKVKSTTGEFDGVSNPFKTYKVYRMIKKLSCS